MGATGQRGGSGGCFAYIYDDTSILTGPSPGFFRVNEPNTVANITEIYVNDVTFGGLDIGFLFDAIGSITNPIKGFVKATEFENPNKGYIFKITSVVDQTGSHNFIGDIFTTIHKYTTKPTINI